MKKRLAGVMTGVFLAALLAAQAAAAEPEAGTAARDRTGAAGQDEEKGSRPLERFGASADEFLEKVSTLVAMADDEEKKEADDWEEPEGPVDRTVKMSFVLQASYRSTWFADERVLPGGLLAEHENTFQIEHTHLKFSGDLSRHLSWEAMPCITHQDNFSVLTANFTYELDPALRITAGRFILPFGQFNLRSLPGMYGPISRPLLYQSHEDRFIQFAGLTPSNFIFTPREDIGVELAGNLWAGPEEQFQISYNGYVTNGLRAVSDTHARFWQDNNNAKMFGGRVGVSYTAGDLSLGAGGSGLRNEYEDNLDQVAWAVDAVVKYNLGSSRKLSVRGEYTVMERDIQPSPALAAGDEEIRGAYVTVDADLTKTIGAFYQWDTLTERNPVGVAGLFITDVETTINRHAMGLKILADDILEVKAEYGFWMNPGAVPNAHRLSIQTILAF